MILKVLTRNSEMPEKVKKTSVTKPDDPGSSLEIHVVKQQNQFPQAIQCQTILFPSLFPRLLGAPYDMNSFAHNVLITKYPKQPKDQPSLC